VKNEIKLIALFFLFFFSLSALSSEFDMRVNGIVSSGNISTSGTVNSVEGLPIGSQIAGVWDGYIKVNVSGNCRKNNVYIISKPQEVNEYLTSYGDVKIYKTGIPGLGYSLNSYRGRYAYTEYGFGEVYCVAGGNVCTSGELGAYEGLKFWKVAEDIKPGSYSGIRLSHHYLWCEGGGTYDLYTSTYTGTLTIKNSSCRPESANTIVNLGQWSSRFFSGIGSKTSNVDINLNVYCPSSVNNIFSKINAVTDDTQPGTIKITEEPSSATGVGIQMVDRDGNPLILNKQFTVVNQAKAGVYKLGWKARYIQTSNKVTSGVANSIVTVEFSYN